MRTWKGTPLQKAREGMLGAGTPPEVADVFMQGLALMQAGKAAILSSDVERVLGRPAASFQQWARDHVGAFG